MTVPEWIRFMLRDMMDKRTGEVAARLTGVPRRSLYRVVAGKAVSRVTIQRIEAYCTRGTIGTTPKG